MDRVPSGRMGGNLTPFVYFDPQNGRIGSQKARTANEYDYLGPTYEQDRTRKTSKRVDNNQLSAVGDKRKIESRVKLVDELHFEANHSDPDDNLNALLKVYSFTILTKMFLTIKVLSGACFAWKIGRGRSCNCSPETGGGNNRHC